MCDRDPIPGVPVRDGRGRRGIARRDLIVASVAVVLLVGVLLLLLLPGREDARRRMCQQRQWAVAKAALDYEAACGEFPGYRNLQATDAAGKPRPTGWIFPLLPHLRPPQPQPVPQPEGGQLGDGPVGNDSAELPAPPYLEVFEQYGPAGPDATRGLQPTRNIVELICPSDSRTGAAEVPNRCYWVANAGMPDAPTPGKFPPDWPANGVFLDLFDRVEGDDQFSTSVALIENHDGPENTLLLTENVDAGKWTDDAEAKVGFVWWPHVEGGAAGPVEQILRINERTGEGDGSIRFARPSSCHPGGVNVVFVSGNQQFLNEQIDHLVYARLIMCNAREVKFPGTDQLVPPPYRLVK